jgi:RNA polymerase sigma-70 factor (ECF subfamily)
MRAAASPLPVRADRILRQPEPDPTARLAPWPAVVENLARRRVDVRRREGESLDSLENRLGTGLMALYRDTRGPECFEALYALSGSSVQQWIRTLLQGGIPALDPAELLQDTFVNVYRYPGAFRADHPGSFRVWVRTIAGNLIRRSRAGRRQDAFQELPDGAQEPADRRGTPADQVQDVDEWRRLGGAWTLFLLHYSRAWGELSQRDRRTLHLVEVEGLSYGEAGEILGVGRSNLKMIVFRARKRIVRRMRQAMNAGLFAPLSEAC